jgi:NAD(P)-dependent dehydrogenase (short-subunit alcohol dehydrogenase family)
VNSVATPEGGQAIIDTALETWGRDDILVNNAGTVSDAVFDDMTDARLSPLLDVHLTGAFLRDAASVGGDAAARVRPCDQYLFYGRHSRCRTDE